MIEDAFRLSVRRTAWSPIATGGIGGMATGVVQALLSGGPENALLLALIYLPFGLVLGGVVFAIGFGAAAIGRSSWPALAMSLPTVAVVTAASAFWLTRGWLLVPLMTVGVIAASVHVLASRALVKRWSSRPAPFAFIPPVSGGSSSRNLRLAALATGAVAVAILSLGAIGMLRETLHLGCGYATMGESDGSWMCADGIGYIFPGLTLVFASGLPLLVGILGVAAQSRSLRPLLRWLAFAPPLVVAGWLAASTANRTDALPTGETWAGVWLASVGLPTCLTVLGAGCVVAAAAPRSRALTRTLSICGGALLLTAFIVQPGLGAPIASCAALLGAVLLRVRESTRATHD